MVESWNVECVLQVERSQLMQDLCIKVVETCNHDGPEGPVRATQTEIKISCKGCFG